MNVSSDFSESLSGENNSDGSSFLSDPSLNDLEIFELYTQQEDRIVSLTWIIENYSYASTEPAARFRSYNFLCGGTKWFLELLPECASESGEIFLAASLCSVDMSETKFVKYKICLKNKYGAECFGVIAELFFEGQEDVESRQMLVRKNALGKSGVVADDVLKVYFEMAVFGHTFNTQLSGDYVMPPKEGITDLIDSKSLGRDLRYMYKYAELTDTVVKTPEAEFRVHKPVLAAHSDVFAAMFEHSMREKSSNLVVIDDVESSVLELFLEFLYIGEKYVTLEQVCEVLRIADKYVMEELRAECLKLLCDAVSMDSFCYLVVLMDTYNDPSLNDTLKTFFIENGLKVILTEKWESLITERPDLADKIKNWYFF